jgi:hypothetical protein
MRMLFYDPPHILSVFPVGHIPPGLFAEKRVAHTDSKQNLLGRRTFAFVSIAKAHCGAPFVNGK